MIKGAWFPRSLRMTTGTFLGEIRCSMTRIGSRIVILQVAAHTSGRRTDKAIRMTANAINANVTTG